MAIQQVHQAEPTEQVEQMGLKRRLFTIEEYKRMIEVNILGEDERIELIRGEIVLMTPIGLEHGLAVAQLGRILNRLLGDNIVVWTQSAIEIAPDSLPQPDIALIAWTKDYAGDRLPAASDVLLVVEVADSSLKHDREEKTLLYAGAGIPEYWIVNVPDRVVEVYSEPAKGTYKQKRQARLGDILPLPGELEGVVQVAGIFERFPTRK